MSNLVGRTTTLHQHSIELLELLLCATHSSQTLLGQLTGTLILAVLEQLHNTALIRSETGHLANQVTDELDTLSKFLPSLIPVKRMNKEMRL
jgi:hypothetical protein